MVSGIERFRGLAELAFPGFAVGMLSGTMAGGLAAIVGQPAGWAMIYALALGLPLGLFGGGYSVLVVRGIARPGTFAAAGLFWLVAFPLARFIQEVLARLLIAGEPSAPPELAGFLGYQAALSAGFAIGFLWMHERIAPQWYQKVAPHNPAAAEVFSRYVTHSTTLRQVRQARRDEKARRRDRSR
jgi:hypothetical protein